jgi:hypothetical protein
MRERREPYPAASDGLALALPDPRKVAVARIAETVKQAVAIRDWCREHRDADTANELRRRLTALAKYVADREARSVLAVEERWTERLLGELLGPAENRGPATFPDGKGCNVPPKAKHEFRALSMGSFDGIADTSFTKAVAPLRYTVGPVWSGDRIDAQREFSDRATWEEAFAKYISTSAAQGRKVALQHFDYGEVYAGQWQEAWLMPDDHDIEIRLNGSTRKVRMAAGAGYLGTVWKPDAWERHERFARARTRGRRPNALASLPHGARSPRRRSGQQPPRNQRREVLPGGLPARLHRLGQPWNDLPPRRPGRQGRNDRRRLWPLDSRTSPKGR